MKKFFVFIGLFCLLPSFSFATIGVISYKPIGVSLEKNYGLEYAKILSVTIKLKKKSFVVSPDSLNKSLNLRGVDSSKNLTKEDLVYLCKVGELDYLLTGILIKKRNSFFVKSILFSKRTGVIVSRFRGSAKNLFLLAEKEINHLFPMLPDRKIDFSRKKIDLLFLLDLSYNIRKEWKLVKNDVVKISNSLLNNSNYNCRLYVVPFSRRYTFDRAFYSNSSTLVIKRGLNRLSPRGKPNKINFIKSLRYSTKSIQWRKNAEKKIFLFLNSKLGITTDLYSYSFFAKSKGVKFYYFPFGKLNFYDNEFLRDFAVSTGGKLVPIYYGKTFYSAKGIEYNLLCAKNRYFLNRSKSLNVIPNVLDEIFFSKRYTPSPYNMDRVFAEKRNLKILRRANLYNNLFKKIEDLLGLNQFMGKKSFNKILCYDGQISVWTNIPGGISFSYLKKISKDNFYHRVAFLLKRDSSSLYGIRFIPILFKIDSSIVPKKMITTFKKIIKNKKQYFKNSFKNMSIWFVDVKIPMVKESRKTEDIRE